MPFSYLAVRRAQWLMRDLLSKPVFPLPFSFHGVMQEEYTAQSHIKGEKGIHLQYASTCVSVRSDCCHNNVYLVPYLQTCILKHYNVTLQSCRACQMPGSLILPSSSPQISVWIICSVHCCLEVLGEFFVCTTPPAYRRGCVMSPWYHFMFLSGL